MAVGAIYLVVEAQGKSHGMILPSLVNVEPGTGVELVKGAPLAFGHPGESRGRPVRSNGRGVFSLLS